MTIQDSVLTFPTGSVHAGHLITIAGNAGTSHVIQRNTLNMHSNETASGLLIADAIASALIDSNTWTAAAFGIVSGTGNGTGCTGGFNNITISNNHWTGDGGGSGFVDWQAGSYSNLSIIGNTIDGGALLRDGFATLTGTYTVSGNTFTGTGHDITSFNGQRPLWTGSVRSNGETSCGAQVTYDLNGVGSSPYTVAFITDGVLLGTKTEGNSGAALIDIDPATLATYPTGFPVTIFMRAGVTNWKVRANSAWNTLGSDYLIVSGVTTLTKNAGGKFDRTA
jgi:hypothetical protein